MIQVIHTMLWRHIQILRKRRDRTLSGKGFLESGQNRLQDRPCLRDTTAHAEHACKHGHARFKFTARDRDETLCDRMESIIFFLGDQHPYKCRHDILTQGCCQKHFLISIFCERQLVEVILPNISKHAEVFETGIRRGSLRLRQDLGRDGCLLP